MPSAAVRRSAAPAPARWTFALVAAVLVTAGCSGDASGDSAEQKGASAPASRSTSAPPAKGTVLQPGKPGETAETLPPDATVAQPKENEADVAFLQLMMPHHAQALKMSAYARTRAQSEDVKSLARRIAGAQGPEIHAMAALLRRGGHDVPTAAELESGALGGSHGQHGDGVAMQGMLSAAEMRELKAARGALFDDLFLEGMIRHHRGAVAMAGLAMTEGSDILTSEIAADVSAGQSAEIDRMKDLQRTL